MPGDSIATRELLDRGAILDACGKDFAARLSALEIRDETGSSNEDLMGLPDDQVHARAILAESQSAGRGRRGRTWYSPHGRNIHLSLGWQFDKGALGMSCLPLVAALAASAALHAAGLNSQAIKWPNDLVLDGRKLGGCLVETRNGPGGAVLAVLGIGINVSMEGAEGAPSIEQAWTDVASHLGAVSRNILAGGLLAELLRALATFQAEGFGPFAEDWNRLDSLAGQAVVLHHGEVAISGVARGVSPRGGLLLECNEANGVSRVAEFTAGEVTFRPC